MPICLALTLIHLDDNLTDSPTRLELFVCLPDVLTSVFAINRGYQPLTSNFQVESIRTRFACSKKAGIDSIISLDGVSMMQAYRVPAIDDLSGSQSGRESRRPPRNVRIAWDG